MPRSARAPAPTTCPSCGRVDHRAPHYCQSCGLDYWRLAAGEPPRRRATAAAALLPAASPVDRRLTNGLMVGGVVGLLLAVAAAAALILPGLVPRGVVIENTLPEKGPAEIAIERFFWEARSPRAEFRVVTEGSTREIAPPGPEVTMQSTIVIDGDDWISHAAVRLGEETVEGTVAQIDGEIYSRTGAEEPWMVVDTSSPPDPASPFARISTVSEVEYVEREARSGGTLHHLRVTKWVGNPYGDWRLLGFDAVVSRENTFDIWVTDDGVPVRGVYEPVVSYREAGVYYTATGHFTLTFSDWGDVEPIELVPEVMSQRQ